MFSHKYLPQTDSDIKEMLAASGVSNLEDLYSDVPESLRLKKDYNIPLGKSEAEVRKIFSSLANKDKQLICFGGAGVYDHYIPSVIDYITSRSEFLTSYTPYQAEISQGTLQYIFEYQSMMSELTGLEVSNASLYDGATATAEAMMTAISVTKKKARVLLSSTLNPQVVRVVETYAKFHGVNLTMIPEKDGVTDLSFVKQELAIGDIAGVIVPLPNYYGIVEDYSGLANDVHAAKAVLIMECVAADLALLKSPGEWGADIAVGSGQSLGLPMAYGGANVGFFCAREEFLRKIPGRIVGATIDSEGKRAFCLTLQTREQHIRREKATSNICSNEGMQTLCVAIYLSIMGKRGLQEAASKSFSGAHYLYEELLKTGKFEKVYDAPFFNEFCLESKINPDKWEKTCEVAGFFGGVRIENTNRIMFAVTELRTKEEMDALVALAKDM